MHISEFDYDLPEDLIAQQPLTERDASRMLVVDRQTSSWQDASFKSFINHIKPNDLVVVNNSRVIPARLIGKRKETGGRVEVFLVRESAYMHWEALVRPGSRLRRGSKVIFGDGVLEAQFQDDPGNELRRVRFECDGSFETVLSRVGSTPLPPYIKRRDGASLADDERYQTVYSSPRGAIAAPTAGLHFTTKILNELKQRNQLAEVTLHVGYGTFEPVRVDEVSKHRVSVERFEITPENARRINEARSSGGRIIAVGTTTTRTLESVTSEQGEVCSGMNEASLTILPGYKFQIVDVLLTNFHLPQSSLLILVSTFADRELIMKAYRHAVRERYRFYSYGDCMLIL